MTDNTDDLRAAREWLGNAGNRSKNIGRYKYFDHDDARHRATIMRRLDQPVCPEGKDVPKDVLRDMEDAYAESPSDGPTAMRAAIDVLRAHLTAPPKALTVKEAALALNTAVDAMWNNKRSDSFVKAVCEAQQQLKRALEAADADE